MVGHMNIGHRFAVIGLSLSAASLVAAEALPDPTRPPAQLQAAAPNNAASAPLATDTPVLQSVLMSAGRPHAAVISGQLVVLGGMVGEMRLVRVAEHAVWLKGPQTTVELALLPGTQKQARHAAPAVSSAAPKLQVVTGNETSGWSKR
jgi:MSHA biogenesis protein MshK